MTTEWPAMLGRFHRCTRSFNRRSANLESLQGASQRAVATQTNRRNLEGH
jgi:hypothetical protein